ncbi:MAG: hypothetical protein HQM09_19395 [Candidatus Riflebacteria bacterium]|nr:hypothetical protein [Candidatus Riflebacteria bacterium]
MLQNDKNMSLQSLESFCEEYIHLSHPDHPLLHKDHSPNSRVPCTNVLTFISQMLRMGDVSGIKRLMRLLVVGNPLGTGDDWTSRATDEIYQWNLKNFIEFSSDNAEFEFKAMCILFEKNGGGREFWIADSPDYPGIASRALSCYTIRNVMNIQPLVEKANSFILKMRKNKSSYWSQVHLFKETECNLDSIFPRSSFENLANLSIPSRLVVLDNIDTFGFFLLQTPKSEIKYLGFNNHESAEEILQSGIMTIADDPQRFLDQYAQSTLFKMCQEKGIEVKKSWKREKLLQILLEDDINFKKSFVDERKPALFCDNTREVISSLVNVAIRRKRLIQLLFCI